MQRISDSITTKEHTEAGDIARSLEKLVEAVFVSQEFWNMVTATRLTRFECQAFAELYFINRSSLLMSIKEKDVLNENGEWHPWIGDDEKNVWRLKKRMDTNQHVANYIISMSWMSMYAGALQSLDGGSRLEGQTMITGAMEKFRDPREMSTWDKFKARVMGNVAYR